MRSCPHPSNITAQLPHPNPWMSQPWSCDEDHEQCRPHPGTHLLLPHTLLHPTHTASRHLRRSCQSSGRRWLWAKAGRAGGSRLMTDRPGSATPLYCRPRPIQCPTPTQPQCSSCPSSTADCGWPWHIRFCVPTCRSLPHTQVPPIQAPPKPPGLILFPLTVVLLVHL